MIFRMRDPKYDRAHSQQLLVSCRLLQGNLQKLLRKILQKMSSKSVRNFFRGSLLADRQTH